MTIVQARNEKAKYVKIFLLGIATIIFLIYFGLDWYFYSIPIFLFIIATIGYKDSKKLIAKLRIQKKVGDCYEKQVGEIFEKNGYRVFYRGLQLGLKDGGIDLEASRGNELVLVQCKNHKTPIGANLIYKFLKDCERYQNNFYSQIKYKNIKRVFVSNSYLDKSAKQAVEQNANKVTFMLIKAKNRKFWYSTKK